MKRGFDTGGDFEPFGLTPAATWAFQLSAERVAVELNDSIQRAISTA
jgi:hypothetical protein